MPKSCSKCAEAFTGFGDTCPECRRNPSRGAPAPKNCEQCGHFFAGFGDTCEPCQEDPSLKVSTPRHLDLPKPQQHALTQIKKFGWRKVHWTDGVTMLHWAATRDQPELADFLVLRYKLDINEENAFGESPLDVAIKKGNSVEQALKIADGKLNKIRELDEKREEMQELALAAQKSKGVKKTWAKEGVQWNK